MVQSTCSSPETFEEPLENKREAQKKLVEALKAEWSRLWKERYDDKVKAEGISVDEYISLCVERGTVIHATRDFKALSFREILEQHMIENAERFIPPQAYVGGWTKFIKTQITNRRDPRGKRARSYVPEKREVQQPKKSGRGWLHVS